ncbi:methyltransferase [Fundidesulfovibrio soli]|uniref:methyltransferase n=1 Tax=Fundidesulfovibrio soli TaxID=2922716 RepID=UPI001FB0463D|nr:methyltransferase [Fundidesulfovibrio soli]
MTDPRILELAVSADSRLEDILALAASRYPVRFETVALGPVSIDILQITDLSAYIDRLAARSAPGEKLTLPFWAKLWPASLPLAMLAAGLAARPGRKVLELGAGLGLCGLAAAVSGCDTTLTDIEPEALLFIRASIIKNGLEAKARTAILDISAGGADEAFDVILASEALYIPSLHAALQQVLLRQLAPRPDAQVLLSCDHCREAAAFFAQAQQNFRIQRTQTTCRADSGDSQTCVLYRMTRRTDA